MSTDDATRTAFERIAVQERYDARTVSQFGVSLKRFFDVGTSLALLIVLAPAFIAIACLIMLIDRQSPFYLDQRVGLFGNKFRCWKFRTIRNNDALLEAYLAENPDEAERYRVSRKLIHDPRKSRLGAFLRRTSLDELPQLFNVLKGDMSLVGPRPITEREFLARGDDRWLLATVRPGMTGLWQVSGRADLAHEDRVELDNQYARDWSLGLDARILLRTPVAVFTAKGAR